MSNTGNINNNNNNTNNAMKRIYRNDMPQAQRDKIAQANTGKHLSDDTRRRISQALTDYWAHLPYKPITDTGNTSTGTTATPGVTGNQTDPYADD